VIDHLHRRTLRALALALAAVWVVTLAFADTAVTPAMHCQRGHMPCCPQSSSSESCSTARCAEQIPEKAEAQLTQDQEDEIQAVVPPVPTAIAPRLTPEFVRELTAGLRYQTPVFRLKDDLRI
jgi:predicted transglutaminase-like cysteine proteinase